MMSGAAGGVVWSLDTRGVATVTFDRAERNNAYDGALIAALHRAMDELGAASGLRAVVLSGNGRHFQAGADLAWIDHVRTAAPAENARVSRRTATAIDRLNRLAVPTLVLVQGGCFGGGTGIVAACDIVIAADNAVFSIAEVRWGLHGGIIVPHLVDAIGVRNVRRYALSGERFTAAEARRIGLVHEVVPLGELEAAGARALAAILENAPGAIAATKAAILAHAESGFDAATLDRLVADHARQRQTAEAAEGLASFREKRSARWGSTS
jgi:methylglutaconyl-CoA hydratase